MSYKNERYMKLVKDIDKNTTKKPEITDKQAEEAFTVILKWIGEDPNREGLLETPKRVVKAFKTILKWLGEDPNREGLLETPKRVMKAYKEYFSGYKVDPSKILDKTFGDVDGYDDMVIQKNISIQSHCEHHMAPIIGKAHVAYIPTKELSV